MSSELPLPILEDYGISPINGFLPTKFPASQLTNIYYMKWENILTNLPSLILTGRLRKIVDELPILEVKDELLNDVSQLRRAYSVLTFIANAYIWGRDTACDTLPDSVAKPLLVVSEALGLPPLATYASLILWNFRPIVMDLSDSDLWDLDNLSTINTFTGAMDESWFYLVSVYFEKVGAKCIVAGMDALRAVRSNDRKAVTSALQDLAEHIDTLGTVLMKMENMCDPYVFYYRIRPYLAGWKQMEDAGLPNGVKYGSEGDYRCYAGGSNAQSSLIQTLDIFLGVEHFPEGVQSKVEDRTISALSNKNSYLNDMRSYMPKEHRAFLEHLAKVCNIRDYVLTNKASDPKLLLTYDACVGMLKSFRDKHIQIVTRYVILQARKGRASRSKTFRAGLSKNFGSTQQTGTGGTSLIPFLKQCRDETGNVAASEWGNRILNMGTLNVRESGFEVAPKRNRSNERNSPGKRQKVVEQVEDTEQSSVGHW
ncbi:HEL041Cp [Eremothecium sinecaudum]|uniref:Indoleamine 2,3-dioxygenase n=1 Tax=Eremothecium sinecaudum TaxID=45286 RepID=A0A0X8HTK9_9SACH|nr:HEL041Cp [Eremothecium sinecaudum]AMD21239.1 HEL041Cp [Eremothecium sinecaudum]